tara:strand:+ start:327 stop:590 length:264 start_codon:yes stop_codon:yes gene_type:complete
MCFLLWGKKRCIFSMDKMRSIIIVSSSFIHHPSFARFAFVGRTPPREKKDDDDGVSSSIAAAALRVFPLFRRRRKRFFEEALRVEKH